MIFLKGTNVIKNTINGIKKGKGGNCNNNKKVQKAKTIQMPKLFSGARSWKITNM